MNTTGIDLIQRHILLSSVVDKVITLLSEEKIEQATHTLLSLKKEIDSTHLPLYPQNMLSPPMTLLSRVAYIIRWWGILWSDLTFQLRISNQRMEKL